MATDRLTETMSCLQVDMPVHLFFYFNSVVCTRLDGVGVSYQRFSFCYSSLQSPFSQISISVQTMFPLFHWSTLFLTPYSSFSLRIPLSHSVSLYLTPYSSFSFHIPLSHSVSRFLTPYPAFSLRIPLYHGRKLIGSR